MSSRLLSEVPQAPLDVAPATLFNAQVADWGSRVNGLVNYLIIVSGGFLSITMGAFISVQPPRLDANGLTFVRSGWYLLATSLVLALLTSFLHIVSQSRVITRMKVLMFSDEGDSRIELVESPLWQRAIIWIVFVAAFALCCTGVGLVSYGASRLLRI